MCGCILVIVIIMIIIKIIFNKKNMYCGFGNEPPQYKKIRARHQQFRDREKNIL